MLASSFSGFDPGPNSDMGPPRQRLTRIALMEISQEVLERFYKPVMCVNARITRQVIILDHHCSKNRLGGSRSQ